MNMTKIKVPIKVDILRYWIKKRNGTINKLSSRIGVSSKTIQRGLSEGELSMDMVYLLQVALNIDRYIFADVEEYERRLMSSIKD